MRNAMSCVPDKQGYLGSQACCDDCETAALEILKPGNPSEYAKIQWVTERNGSLGLQYLCPIASKKAVNLGIWVNLQKISRRPIGTLAFWKVEKNLRITQSLIEICKPSVNVAGASGEKLVLTLLNR